MPALLANTDTATEVSARNHRHRRENSLVTIYSALRHELDTHIF